MKLRDEETQILYEFTISDQGEYVVEPIDDDRSNWHPHHDLIISWARGAEIEFFHKELKVWKYCKPAWNVGDQYRIKPDNSEEIAELEAEYESLQKECYEVAKKLNQLRGER